MSFTVAAAVVSRLRKFQRNLAKITKPPQPDPSGTQPVHALVQRLTFLDRHLRVLMRMLTNARKDIAPEVFDTTITRALSSAHIRLDRAVYLANQTPLEGGAPPSTSGAAASDAQDSNSDAQRNAWNQLRRVLRCAEWFSLDQRTRHLMGPALVRALAAAFACMIGVRAEDADSDIALLERHLPQHWGGNAPRCRDILAKMKARVEMGALIDEDKATTVIVNDVDSS